MIDDPAVAEAAVLDPRFLARVLERHRAEAHLLLADAADEWVSDGCVRFSDDEVACTAAVAGRLKHNLQRRRATGLQLLAFLETGGWTEAHLDGSANPATVPRPDLALFLGVHHDVQMTIECKRLLQPSATARGYVRDGLCRFLDGRYPTDSGRATMIGFLLDRDVARAKEQINRVIVHVLDEQQVLQLAPSIGRLDTVCLSQHPEQKVEATHLLLDMRDRGPATGPSNGRGSPS